MAANRPLKRAYYQPCKYNSFGNIAEYLIIQEFKAVLKKGYYFQTNKVKIFTLCSF